MYSGKGWSRKLEEGNMARKKAIVLGCGLVGSAMARDLAADDEIQVTAVDVSEPVLSRLRKMAPVQTRCVDLSDPAVVRTQIADFDIVLGAMPSRFGFQTLRTVIESGKPYGDISFMPEDALELDEAARSAGVTAVVDAGVSPGLSNLLVAHADRKLDQTRTAVIYVGGLPKARTWPYHYKAPFAPSDVIEEYTRPARMVIDGRLVEKPALSEPELITLPKAGELEAFNTDGLRSLLATLDIPNMKEKTLRYPGHIELMRVFRETGFFGKQAIEVDGVSVRPLDLTSKLLFQQWALEEGEEEFTVMRVQVDGKSGERSVRYTYDLYDEYDHAKGMSSMARTTGFPCTILARMLAGGELAEPGVVPLEQLAPREDLVKQLMTELDRRGVMIEERVENID